MASLKRASAPRVPIPGPIDYSIIEIDSEMTITLTNSQPPPSCLAIF